MNRQSFRSVGRLISTALVTSCWFALSTAPMQAQAPTTAVGSTSGVQTATLTITTAGTLSNIAVVTQGATGLDFQAVTNGAATPCTTGTDYNVNDTCTVQYTFSPTRPWIRYGGISLSDSNGVLLGNLYLTGKGTAPQVSFPPIATTVPTTLFGGPGTPAGVALDGSGNLYFVDYNGNSLKEIPATSGVIPTNPAPAATTVATAFSFPSGVAVDGSGNIFVIDASGAGASGALKEIVAVGGVIPVGATPVTLATGLNFLTGLAVDGSGNVYVSTGNSILEYAAVNGVIPASPTATSVNGTTAISPAGVAVDAAGDVYYTHHNGSAAGVQEFVATAGVIPANPPAVTLAVVNGNNTLNALAIDGAGNIYVPDPANKSVYEIEAVNGSFTGVPTPVVATLSSTLIGPFGLAIDGSGNIFIAENNGTPGPVDELNVQTPPTLTFTSSAPGSVSSDSPMSLTVANNGTDDLVFPNASLVTMNPSISGGDFGFSNTSTCTVGDPSDWSLGSGMTCTLAINFRPSSLGPESATLNFADNSLNVATATQMGHLDGGVASPTIAVTSFSAPVNTTSNTLTATITYNGVMPTGAVTFTVNGLPAGGIAATCTGAASPLTCTAPYDDSSLAAAPAGYPIVATFAGDTSNNPATGTGTLTVTPGTPGLTVGTSGSPAAVNAPITFTANLTPSTGTIVPTGTVSFTSTLGAGSPIAIAGCTNVPVTAAAASCTTTTASALPAGSYTITANYGGDPNFNSATATVAQMITAATPGVVVTSSSSSVPVNTQLTFTAAVTPTSGIVPTGTVSFSAKLGAGAATPISGCTAQTLTAGSAICQTSALGAGSYTITATVASDPGGNFTSATSPGLLQIVTKVDPGLVLSTSGSPSIVDGSVTFTALVTPNTGVTPAGPVTFYTALNGGTAGPISAACTNVPLTGSGPTLKATCTTPALQGGSNSVTATNTADSNFNSATSNAVTQVVNPATPTLTLATSGSPSVVDNTVTFTATVTPNTGIVPGGTVTFTTTLNGTTTTLSCSPVTLVPGTSPTRLTAACATAALLAGANTVTATLAADTNFLTASNTVAQTVTSASTSLAITSSLPASSTVDQSVTFTATLSPLGAPFTVTPGGTVSFTSNGVNIPACSGANAVTVDPTAHTAKCATSALVVPSDVIAATYSGDANFKTSTAPQFTQIVTQAVPVIAVTSSPAAPVVNQTVTFTATITPAQASGNGVAPTGSVKFTNGSGGPVVCGPVVVTSNANGTGGATCSVPFTSVLASTSIFAVYSSDTNFTAGNSPSVALAVSAAPTTTSVSLPDNPAVVNQSVTLIATVTPSNSGAGYPGTATPQSGTVVFSDSLDLTGSPFCSTPVTATGGTIPPVNCTHTFTSTGPHVITAVFTSSDPNFANSTTQNSATQTVNTAGTTGISVTTTPMPLVPTPIVNQSVTFNAAFTPTPVGAQPQGSISYTDSALVGTSGNPTGTIPGCTTAVISSGTIPSCTETMLVAGTHNITVVFTTSDTNFKSVNSPPFPQAVALNSTTVALTVLPASSVADQSLTFAATISPVTPPAAGNSTPTNPGGTVAFSYLLNGTTTNICTGTVSTTGGVTTATCSAPLTAANTYPVTATYSGDTNFSTSASASHSQVVSKANTNVALSGASLSTPASPAVNQLAPYSVQISVLAPANDTLPGSTVPTGNVVFTDTTTSAACTAVVQPSGLASCQLAEPTSGTHSITVAYNGDSNFAASSIIPSPSVTTVASGTTVTNVGVNPAAPAVNANTTLTATLNPAFSGTTAPNGTVVFSDTIGGVTTNCTSQVTAGSVAPCPYIFTSAGAHTVTAMFNPSDTSFSSSTSTPLVVTVGGAAPTTIQVGSTTPSIVVNQVATFTAAFTPTIVGTQPAGTVSYLDGTDPISGCTNLTVTAAGAIPGCTETMLTAGTHNITAMFTSGNGNFSNITSPVFPQSVGQNTTKTVLTSPTAPSIVNQPLTFTATVTPGTAGPGTTVPGGTVIFTYVLNGGPATAICAGVVTTTASGTSATCTAPLVTAGTYTVTAAYSGDTNFVTSTSATISQTVNQNMTTVAITSPAPNTPDVVDQVLTFSATVTPVTTTPAAPGSTTPSGTVSFFQAGSITPLCIATVSLNAGTSSASCTALFPALGTYMVTATYKGDNNFGTSTSTAISQVVAQEGTSIAFVSSSPATPTIGQQATYTVQVSLLNTVNGNVPVNDNVAGASVPTGTVTFLDAATNATCTAPTTPAVVLGTGQASCSIVEPNSGPHSITATYNGDPNFIKSTTTFSETVNSAPLTLNLNASSPTIIATTAATFTASFVFPGTAPTGTVTFFATDASGAQTTLCTSAVATTPATGTTASCTPTFNAGGVYTISAHYGGDNNYNAADAPTVSLTVQSFSFTVAVKQTSANPPVLPPNTALLLAQGSTTIPNTNVADAYNRTAITYTFSPSNGFTDKTSATCTVSDSTGAVVTNPSCTLTTDPLGQATGAIVLSATAAGTALSPVPAPPVGNYTVKLTIKDIGVPNLTQSVSTTITVTNQPAPVFVGAVGQVSAKFTLPSFLAAPPSSTGLKCNSQLATSNTDGTYTVTTTLAAVGLQCSGVTLSTSPTDPANTYTFTIFAGESATARTVKTSNSGIVDALLGAPFLLLFGLLPAFRKQRKLLVRGLGIFLLGIALFQTTGCGGGGFPSVTPPQATSGTYLVSIVNAANVTVAEVPVDVGQ